MLSDRNLRDKRSSVLLMMLLTEIPAIRILQVRRLLLLLLLLLVVMPLVEIAVDFVHHHLRLGRLHDVNGRVVVVVLFPAALAVQNRLDAFVFVKIGDRSQLVVAVIASGLPLRVVLVLFTTATERPVIALQLKSA